jgi:hypothetical protein
MVFAVHEVKLPPFMRRKRAKNRVVGYRLASAKAVIAPVD